MRLPKRITAPVLSCFALLFFLLMPGCAGPHGQAAKTACPAEDWPWQGSDLQPDPALRAGRLDNGLRFVIMPNSEPADRVSLHLLVLAGSLQETEEQLGLAHFLEHMAFNGTAHYPPGTLVEYFQSIGMGFGADTNAHTTFDQTVYKLLLPSGSREHLSKGLEVLADYARTALLLEDEVERERGVILSEKLARDTAESRVQRESLQFSFQGTLAARRDIIGVEETLYQADSARLRAYYESWYRPENMVLVVVGDVAPALVLELLQEQMGGLKPAPGSSPACLDYGRVDEQSTRARYQPEPELGRTHLSIESTWNLEPPRDDTAWERKQFLGYVASSLLQNRLERLIRQPDSPLTEARMSSGVFLRRIGYASLTAEGDGERWMEGFTLLGTTLHQALRDGFGQAELDRAKREIAAYLENQAQTAASRDSNHLAGMIVRKLGDGEVILSPQQEQELFGAMLAELQLEEVNKAFRDLWRYDNRILTVAGTADLGTDRQQAEERIISLFQQSMGEPLPPWQEEAAVSFPYLPIPAQAGVVKERKALPGLAAERVVFTNGTILHLKKTDFQPNELQLAVHFGNGLLGQPQAGMAQVADLLLFESGFGGISRDALQEALAGRNATSLFRVGEESFVIQGKGLQNEAELLCQLVFHQLYDPAFRSAALQRVRERLSQQYDELESSVEGGMQLHGEAFLAGGNMRYGLAARQQIEQVRLADVEQWLRPVFQTAPLEISVVGDFDPEVLIALVGRYFGTAPRDGAPALLTGDKIVFPAGQTLRREMPSSAAKSLVMVGWPTGDFWDISRTRRLNVLASVLDDRLRREIREKMGATYSPVVFNRSSRVDPGFGVLAGYLVADAARAELLADKVRQTAAALAKNGPDEDELQRALRPTLTSIKDMLRNNNYWLSSVLALSSRHPQQLEWPLTIQQDFAAITAEDIAALARNYLREQAAATVLLLPGK